jgi:hypothetical protein
VRKTDNMWYFSKPKGHNLVINQWTGGKNCTSSVTWHCKAMYQISTEYMYTKRKKVRQIDILRPRTITYWKINGPKPNSKAMYQISNEYLISGTKTCGKLIYRTDIVQTLSPLRLHQLGTNNDKTENRSIGHKPHDTSEVEPNT